GLQPAATRPPRTDSITATHTGSLRAIRWIGPPQPQRGSRCRRPTCPFMRTGRAAARDEARSAPACMAMHMRKCALLYAEIGSGMSKKSDTWLHLIQVVAAVEHDLGKTLQSGHGLGLS